jgi:hypothetical protein
MSLSTQHPARSIVFRAAGIALLALVVCLPPVSQAAPPAQSGLTMDAVLGFDGYFREGVTAPVRVTVSNDGPDLEAEIQIALPGSYLASTADALYVRPVSLPSRSRKLEYLYVPGSSDLRSAQVLLVRDGNVLARATLRGDSAEPGDVLIGLLSSRPSTLDLLAGVHVPSATTRVAALTLDALPPHTAGWDALSALIVDDVDTTPLSEAQRAALDAWIERGGHLIVAGGPGWQSAAAGLDALLPAAATGTVRLDALPGLATVNAAPLAPGPYVLAALNLRPGAQIALSQGDTPLIVWSRRGAGRVTVLALSTTTAPLDNWGGGLDLWKSDILLETLANPQPPPPTENVNAATEALRTLPGLELPPALDILGFLLLYVLAIGPLNYFVLRRLRKPELAWITIPALVVLFTTVTYITGFQFRGTTPTLHRLAVVSARAGAARAQADLLVGLYSPQRRSYDLRVAGRLPLRPLSVDPSNTIERITILTADDATVARDVRVDIAGMRLFSARVNVPAPRIAVDITRNGLRFTGVMRNTGDVTLQQVCLLWGSSAVLLGDLAPGAEMQIDQTMTASTYGYDMLDQISGVQPYGNNSRDAYRRRSLATAALVPSGSPYYSGTVHTPTAHAYLTAWVDGFPGEVTLDGSSTLTSDLTLYVIQIPKDSERTLVPLLDDTDMDWTVVEAPGGSGAGNVDLRNLQLDPGQSVAVEFTPRVTLNPKQVVRLDLTIDSYNTGSAAPTVSLWDWGASRWVQQEAITWATPLIVEPAARYVDAGGVFRLRFTAPSGDSIFLSGFQLALEGTP